MADGQHRLRHPEDAGLHELVEQAAGRIAEAVAHYRRPALLWSGGKDSTVMLHVARHHARVNLPVVQLRDPWFPRKWRWARWLAEQWELEVHDFPPAAQLLYEQDGKMALVSRYSLGAEQWLDVPKDVVEWEWETPEAERLPSLCGVTDFLGRPCGRVPMPWDVVLIGHKDADIDPILGQIPLHSDRVALPPGAPDALFPMREWTDEDVWDYADTYQVPMDEDRYDRRARRTRDAACNNDVLPACVACLDRRPGAAAQVPCPKLNGALVENVAARVPWLDTIVGDYFDAERRPHEPVAAAGQEQQ